MRLKILRGISGLQPCVKIIQMLYLESVETALWVFDALITTGITAWNPPSSLPTFSVPCIFLFCAFYVPYSWCNWHKILRYITTYLPIAYLGCLTYTLCQVSWPLHNTYLLMIMWLKGFKRGIASLHWYLQHWMENGTSAVKSYSWYWLDFVFYIYIVPGAPVPMIWVLAI